MTRIRQLVLSGVLALVVSLSFASVASADPKDSGFEKGNFSAMSANPKGNFSAMSADPKDGGFQP